MTVPAPSDSFRCPDCEALPGACWCHRDYDDRDREVAYDGSFPEPDYITAFGGPE